MVSGNDDFLSGSTNNQAKDPVLHQEQGEKLIPEKTQKDFSATVTHNRRGDSSRNEGKSRKMQKRLTKEAKDPSTSRENSLIW